MSENTASTIDRADEHRPTGARYTGLVWLFAGCFFLSGCTGLIYQNVWVRILGLYFGNTAFAISAVLTAFMAGLALGSWLVSGRSDRLRNPLIAYATIELLIGFYCLATPALLAWANDVYSQQVIGGDLDDWERMGIQFGLCLVVLVIPTALMGSTLPILSAGLQRIMGTVAKTVGNLYAINTFGAVAGTLVTAFVLLQYVGVQHTIHIAAAANIGIGLLLLVFTGTNAAAKRARREYRELKAAPEAAVSVESASGRGIRRFMLYAFFIAGFCALTCEIVWTRVLCMMIGSSVYSFAVILTAFLLGIALGSYVFALFWGERKVGIESFGVTETLIGLCCIVLTYVFSWLPEVFLGLFVGYNEIAVPEALLGAELAIAFLVVCVPTMLMGLTFPLVTKVLTDAGGALGSSVGRAYAANTAGAILGSCLATLVLFPLIGMRWVLLGAGALYVLIGIISMFIASARKPSWLPVGAVCGVAALALIIFLPSWNTSALSFGVFQSNQVANTGAPGYLAYARANPDRLAFYQEGRSAVVSVTQWEDPGGEKSYAVAVNGKVDASTSSGDMPTQVMTGHLPCLLMDDPERVLLVGLGSGISAACIARHKSVKEVICVEIERNMGVAAERFFGPWNDNILTPGVDTRFHLEVDDGRSYIQRATQPFDIIISEPSNPWIAGVGNLYTQEFYQICRDKLKPDGLMVQWTQLYSLSPTTLRMILNTFSSVFENISVFHPTEGDLLVVASPSPIVLDNETLQRRLDGVVNRSYLEKFGANTPEALTSFFLLSDADLRRLAADADLNTDDIPLLEFWAPRTLYGDFGEDNFRQLLEARSDRLPPPEQMKGFPVLGKAGSKLHTDRGVAYQRRGSRELALKEFIRAVELDSESSKALSYLARALTDDRKPYLGLEYAQKALRLSPRSARAHNAIGYALWNLYDFDGAIRHFKTACELAPDNQGYADELDACGEEAAGFDLL